MGNMNEILSAVVPIVIFLLLIGCCVYCFRKICECFKECCCKTQTPGVIIDTGATEPLSPTVQHVHPPAEAVTLLAHQQMCSPANYYPPQMPLQLPPQSPPPQYAPSPYPLNATQPPMNYYPLQPHQLPPMGVQPPYQPVNYNPSVPPHCPLPPIPQQTETAEKQPGYNPNYVPSAPPP